jgi:hypothetical protein
MFEEFQVHCTWSDISSAVNAPDLSAIHDAEVHRSKRGSGDEALVLYISYRACSLLKLE